MQWIAGYCVIFAWILAAFCDDCAGLFVTPVATCAQGSDCFWIYSTIMGEAVQVFSRTIGHLDQFDTNIEPWESYYERFEQYVIVNKLDDGDLVPCLLSVVGPKTYSLLRTLVAPAKPKDKSIADIKKVLNDHLSPQPLTIAERFRFYKRDQKSNESVIDYAAEIQRLAERCNFGTFLDEALRDKLVCGINGEHIQKRLLTESELSFKKALNMATSMETAAKDSHELAQARSASGHVKKVTTMRHE